MKVFVAVNSQGGTVYEAPDGTTYHLWVPALNAPVGRALVSPTTTAAVRERLHAFDTVQAMIAWVLADIASREGQVVH